MWQRRQQQQQFNTHIDVGEEEEEGEGVVGEMGRYNLLYEMNALLLKAIHTIDGIFQCNFLYNLRSPNSSPSNELNIDPTSIISGDGYL